MRINDIEMIGMMVWDTILQKIVPYHQSTSPKGIPVALTGRATPVGIVITAPDTAVHQVAVSSTPCGAGVLIQCPVSNAGAVNFGSSSVLTLTVNPGEVYSYPIGDLIGLYYQALNANDVAKLSGVA